MASEMLYPVMPAYLRSIGFSIVAIGLLEGLAEAVAGLSKGYFGKLSDHKGRRVPFVQLGYSLSALSKPLMALLIQPLWIFFARTIDRLGKGIRTGARDALLSSETTPEHKGRVFGFHRSWDTIGAVLGPAAALIYLYFRPGEYRTLFLVAFLPGVLAILLTFKLKESKVSQEVRTGGVSFFSFMSYWKISPLKYRQITIGFLLFALINSSDIFLLLRMKDIGLNDTQTIGVYIFYNLVYALLSYPVGILADKIGFRKMFVFGLSLFVLVYIGFGVFPGFYSFALFFFLYGLYAAATEGVSKAWISNVVKREDTATAIGAYTAFQSICLLLASTLAGLIWTYFGAATLFIWSGALAAVIVVYFLRLMPSPRPNLG